MAESWAESFDSISSPSISGGQSPLRDESVYTKSIHDRLFAMLQTGTGVDVKFLVGSAKEVVNGHKLILGSGSPVFHSMFYGGLESENQILLPDSDSEAFRATIEYLYRGTFPSPNILTEKPSEILYLVRKYHLQTLEDDCVHQLVRDLTSTSVIQMLELAQLYDIEKLRRAAWSHLCHSPLEVFRNISVIEQIDITLLKSVLLEDQINVPELQLFLIALDWASAECTREGLEVTPEVKRDKLVKSGLLDLIRFPIMDPAVIAKDVVTTGILTTAEVTNIFVAKYNPEAESIFKRTPRRPTQSHINLRLLIENRLSSSSSSDSDPFRNFGNHSRSMRRNRRRSTGTTNASRRLLRQPNPV